MTIRLDYTNMMAPPIDGGITESEWRDVASRFEEAHRGVADEYAGGTLGFLDLPENRALHQQTLDYVQQVKRRAGELTDVVVLGIGGSALGPIALRTSLRPPQWNLLDDAARGGEPRLHVLDNVDPANISALLGRLDLRRSLFVVISKSGGTAETMAQYLVVRARLNEVLGEAGARERLVFVTDPQKGALRTIARNEKIAALEIPANVGGRFSVLTPVGILPAALIGIDTADLLAGSADMRTVVRFRCSCRTAMRCATWPTGSCSSGRRAWASIGLRGTPAWGLPRSGRSGRPTSTARCSCSWRGRATRRSPSSVSRRGAWT
jgi:glucose-6-phosphate isomerase